MRIKSRNRTNPSKLTLMLNFMVPFCTANVSLPNRIIPAPRNTHTISSRWAWGSLRKVFRLTFFTGIPWKVEELSNDERLNTWDLKEPTKCRNCEGPVTPIAAPVEREDVSTQTSSEVKPEHHSSLKSALLEDGGGVYGVSISFSRGNFCIHLMISFTFL